MKQQKFRIKKQPLTSDYKDTCQKQSPGGVLKKGVLENFAKCTGKHLCQSLFLNKVAGLRPATLLKERLWHRSFPVNFAKFLRTPYFIEHLWWLFQSCPESFRKF